MAKTQGSGSASRQSAKKKADGKTSPAGTAAKASTKARAKASGASARSKKQTVEFSSSAEARSKLIQIRGARTHNLKNIDLDLPRDKLIVITGLSGSGKSSLAFDTIFAEGQRRYVESLSAYARQFLSVMDKPDVDHIDGLSPAISIEQKSTSHNPRSTVGTITEINDYLRLLYARVGIPHCPQHQEPLQSQTISQMVDTVLAQPEGTALMLLAPLVSERKGDQTKLLDGLRAQGYLRARINGEMQELDTEISLSARSKHTIEVVIDRFKIREDLAQRLADSMETAVRLGDETAIVAPLAATDSSEDMIFSTRYACSQCGYSIAPLEPRSFSFNSPHGACPDCDGLGIQQFFDQERIITNDELSLAGGAIRGWDRRTTYYFQMIQCLAAHYKVDVETPFQDLPESFRQVVLFGSDEEEIEFIYLSERGNGSRKRTHTFEGIIPNMDRRFRDTTSAAVREELSKLMSVASCKSCKGARLSEGIRNVLIADTSVSQLSALSIAHASEHLENLELSGQRAAIAEKILAEINQRLRFLLNVGLNYLSLDRSADTLSGGEAQRIRLASQIGAGLMGVMYVLDEPSIGLHQRDNHKLLATLNYLRDLGNTVIVVEHDQDAISSADYIVDIGPGAGTHGGEIVAEGTLEQILDTPQSLTGKFLSGEEKIDFGNPVVPGEDWIKIVGASGNNLKNIDVELPIGLLTCITGVSGSGKSTLINATLYKHASSTINGSKKDSEPVSKITGLDKFDKIVEIDQSPIGRTPRSNPATYTGLFTAIRDLFAGTKKARTRGYKNGRFSFNVKGGRCEACQGDGLIKVEMHFLPDVYVPCDICGGDRYNRETLEIQYKGKNISEVLQLTVEDALDFFSAVPTIAKKLQTLQAVGLSYVTLGQNATTLSGGEAQRVKLSRELSKRDTGNTLYILDEPTTGLHFQDVRMLLSVLHQLRDQGNTILVIEHNLDVIKTADWIVDLGPEGGDAGGELVACGPPELICAAKDSHTGKFLSEIMSA